MNTVHIDLSSKEKLDRFAGALAACVDGNLPPTSVMTCDHFVSVAKVCAWCPDKAIGDAWAQERGYIISHGICRECERKAFAEIEVPKQT